MSPVTPIDGRRFCVISPCRDETEYMRFTLDSVTAQTIPPTLWVIVDDGSTDGTAEILREYADQFNYIRIVHRTGSTARRVGPGVVEAFYEGYREIDPEDFDYICKLDLDLELPPKYFQTLIERMEADLRLGSCSGKPYNHIDGRLEPEPCDDSMSVGMTKFYRTPCFEQIGGFEKEVMWDGIDCHRSRMLGWKVRAWSDSPDLRFVHLRPMGSSQKGILTGRMRHGFGQWFMGTSLPYILVSAAFRSTKPPILLGGLSILWGYLRSAIAGKPRYGDPEFRKFLRRYHWDCLSQGKSKAAETTEERMAPNFRGTANR